MPSSLTELGTYSPSPPHTTWPVCCGSPWILHRQTGTQQTQAQPYIQTLPYPGSLYK